MATTALDICNNALMQLGQKKMVSLSEDSDKARLADGMYTQVRDRILRGHPWNCSIKRTVLEAAAFSPKHKSALLTISGRNISRDASAAAWAAARGNASITTGQQYLEITIGDMLTDICIGICKSAMGLSDKVGADAYGWGYQASTGNKVTGGVATAYGDPCVAGDVIGIIPDITNGKLYFTRNGVVQGGGDPVAGTGAAFTGLSGAFFPAISLYDPSSTAESVFLDADFAYDPPTGFGLTAWPGVTPAWGYSYALPLPSDWLRNVQVGQDEDDIDFKSEDGNILADDRAIDFRYVYRNEDPDTWDSQLVDVVTQAMASVMCYAITQSTSKEQTEWDKLKMLLREARAVDGQDDQAQMLGDLRLVASRFR